MKQDELVSGNLSSSDDIVRSYRQRSSTVGDGEGVRMRPCTARTGISPLASPATSRRSAAPVTVVSYVSPLSL